MADALARCNPNTVGHVTRPHESGTEHLWLFRLPAADVLMAQTLINQAQGRFYWGAPPEDGHAIARRAVNTCIPRRVAGRGSFFSLLRDNIDSLPVASDAVFILVGWLDVA